MQKVLSTKLRSDEVDRFATMAEQQGESKCSLLKHNVQDYLDDGSKSGYCIPSWYTQPNQFL